MEYFSKIFILNVILKNNRSSKIKAADVDRVCAMVDGFDADADADAEGTGGSEEFELVGLHACDYHFCEALIIRVR